MTWASFFVWHIIRFVFSGSIFKSSFGFCPLCLFIFGTSRHRPLRLYFNLPKGKFRRHWRFHLPRGKFHFAKQNITLVSGRIFLENASIFKSSLGRRPPPLRLFFRDVEVPLLSISLYISRLNRFFIWY